MLTVNLCDLPCKLQNSEYYESFTDTNDQIIVPESCTRLSLFDITTVDELAYELRTALYWGYHDTPHYIWDAFVRLHHGLCSEAPNELNRQLCRKVPNLNKTSVYTELVALNAWLLYNQGKGKPEYITDNNGIQYQYKISREMTAGGSRLLEYLVDTKLVKATQKLSLMCNYAMNGHFECLEYLRKKWCQYTVTDTVIIESAVYGGQLECLKAMHLSGWPWDKWTCSCAATHGHLECLRYAHENGCPWENDTLHQASKYGHLDCLRYAIEHGCLDSDPTYDAIYCAATGGHVDCIVYLRSIGYSLPLLSSPVYNGHLECLKYMVESGSVGGPDDVYASYTAAEYGQLGCLKYLCSVGLVWSSTDGDQMVDAAARGGHLDCLQYLYAQGYRGTADTVTAACRGGHFKCLRYLINQKCPYNKDAFITAEKRYQVRCLRYLKNTAYWKTGFRYETGAKPKPLISPRICWISNKPSTEFLLYVSFVVDLLNSLKPVDPETQIGKSGLLSHIIELQTPMDANST